MLKKNTQINRKGMTYDTISIDERKQIMELKRLGMKAREIAKIMNKKLKSIDSVKSVERQSQYKEFKQTMIQYGLNICKEKISYQMMDKKKLSKLVRILINQALSSKKNKEFRLLVPINRQGSSQRRIKESIVQTIVTCLLSNKDDSSDDKNQIKSLNQNDIMRNQEISDVSSCSNPDEQVYQENCFSDYNDYSIIDPITPLYLGLNEKIILKNFQQKHKIRISEDLSTNYENTYEIFKQSVELSS